MGLPDLVQETGPNVTENVSNSSDVHHRLFPGFSDLGVATIIITSSLGAGAALCLGFCVFIWWRKLKSSRRSSVSPAKQIIRSPSHSNFHAFNHPIEFILPTVSVSEAPTTEEDTGVSESDSTLSRSPTLSHRPFLSSRASISVRRSAPVLSSPSQTQLQSRPQSWDRFSISPEELERELYLNLEAEEPEPTGNSNLGKVSFSVHYIVKKRLLEVTVISAMNLPAKFRKGSADPYIKVTILPEKSPKFVTGVKRNSLNPIYNEMFTFSMRKMPLDGKRLRFSACDYDKFSRRVVIGYVVFPLHEAGIVNTLQEDVETGEIIRDLRESVDEGGAVSHNGELCVTVCYDPVREQLTLFLEKARDIKTQDDREIAAVYAKVTLYDGKRVIKSKKTPVRKKTSQPVFNETFSIQLPKSYLSDVYTVISVCSKNKLGSRKLLGKASIGPFSYVTGSGLDQWNDMIHQANKRITRWHQLL